MAQFSLNTPYFVLTGAIIIGIAVMFILYQPMLNTIIALQNDIKMRQAVLKEKEEFLQTIDRKLKDLTAQVQHEQQLEVVLPARESFEDALRIVEIAAATAGGTIIDLGNDSGSAQAELNSQRSRGEAVAIPSSVKPLGIRLTYIGTYQQLRVFLEQLERSPRLIDITAFNVTSSTEAPDQLTGDLSLHFYSLASSNEGEARN